MTHLQRNFDLTNANTLRLQCVANAYAEFDNLTDLQDLLRKGAALSLTAVVLGGGSNVLMPETLNSLVVKASCRAISKVRETADRVVVDVDAGMNWHQWVKQSIEFGHGLENLALIPGTVGAAPVQNIGAYGVEVGELIESVTGYQLSTQQLRTFTAAECRFGYRDSVFKRELKSDFIILRVRFALKKAFAPVLNYAPLDQLNAGSPTAEELISAVVATRQAKLPDPAQIPNAGSYFQNPVVSKKQADTLKQAHPTLPVYPQLHGVKLAAGWLIDQCGFRGKAFGPVAMYEKQALVLTAPGDASLKDVRALEKEVQQAVQAKFRVSLEPEPQLFGA